MEEIIAKGRTQKTGEKESTINHEVWLVLVTKIGLVDIYSDYSIRITTNGYTATGSGYQAGYGSLYTSWNNKNTKGDVAVKLAVEAACKHTPYCGGKTHSIRVKQQRKNKKNDSKNSSSRTKRNNSSSPKGNGKAK